MDYEHYTTERRGENWETDHLIEDEKKQVARAFRYYGMQEEQVQPIVKAMTKDRERWTDFMMQFELGLEKPESKRAQTSAMTIVLSYIAGGFIPLNPYML